MCLCWNGAWTGIVEWTMEWTLEWTMELKEKHFLFPTVLCNYLLTISIHSQLASYWPAFIQPLQICRSQRSHFFIQ